MQLIPIKEATDDSTYRVEFIGGMAHIECFGLTVTPIVGLENGEVVMPIAEIPEWLERRVAVLCSKTVEAIGGICVLFLSRNRWLRA